MIHAAVIEGISSALWALISNGRVKESIEKFVELRYSEVDIFIAVCEHAYTGTYSTPESNLKKLCPSG
jgi:hypothetical protein